MTKTDVSTGVGNSLISCFLNFYQFKLSVGIKIRTWSAVRNCTRFRKVAVEGFSLGFMS